MEASDRLWRSLENDDNKESFAWASKLFSLGKNLDDCRLSVDRLSASLYVRTRTLGRYASAPFKLFNLDMACRWKSRFA